MQKEIPKKETFLNAVTCKKITTIIKKTFSGTFL
jgi:hypothetical protein